MSDQLRHTLLNYEAAPPQKAWEAISEALEDQNSALAERLYQLEQMPDGRAWKQIENKLDAVPAQDSPVLPSYRRYRQPLRYAGAVAILALAAMLTILLINRNERTNKLAQGPRERTSIDNPTPAQPGSASGTQETDPGNGQSNEAAQGAGGAPDEKSANPPLAAGPSARTASNRYMTVADEEGQPVRLSKKVYPVFDCAEHSTAVKRYRCRENIEALQQKMASSLASPSGDFASLMDMIRTLEENP